MGLRKILLKTKVWSLAALCAVLLIRTVPAAPAQAEDDIVLTLRVPGVWEDVITDEMLAEFEALYPGVKVHLEFTGGGGGLIVSFVDVGQSIDERLQNTAELVSSADVMYVDSSTLYPEATLAGYFLDLSPLVSSDSDLNPEDFLPAAWESFRWENGFWALPLSVDVVTISYNPAAFDEAGLSYPTESWTLEDYANAARRLTEYDAEGNVSLPGLFSGFDSYNIAALLRALYGRSLIDNATSPEGAYFTDPEFVMLVQSWAELQEEGVASTLIQDPNDLDRIPIRIDTGFSIFGSPGGEAVERQTILLPGSTSVSDTQGFAISSGTQYPEEAYALAKFLTTRGELANNFFSSAPARYSIEQSAEIAAGQFTIQRQLSPEMQEMLDRSLEVALPMSELRYAGYLTLALERMRADEIDANTALQDAEARVQSHIQTALDRRADVEVVVATPAPDTLAEGQTILKFGLGSNFRILGGGELPNQDVWDQLSEAFVADESTVGRVEIESAAGSLTDMVQEYDCFTLPYNGVTSADLSTLLSLDPLLDTDATFDRNDVIGNTLQQLQQDNRTWAYPIAIDPRLLQYNPEVFAMMGVTEPVEGWTTDEFIDALRQLKEYSAELKPFNGNDPSGSYLNTLIAAFGGIPIDYRTTPPTIQINDPATVDAIRQVLDLAKAGYIEYSELSSNTFVISTESGEEQSPILGEGFNFGFGPGPNVIGEEDNPYLLTVYPQNSQYGVISYDIITGYISANAQDPEACYRWFNTIAQHPELFSGIPARRSLLTETMQQDGTSDVLNQVDSLLRDPNTVVLPSNFRADSSIGDFLLSYWLRRAYDNYVLRDADLQTELDEVQTFTSAYQACTLTIVPEEGELGANFEAFQECAQRADPTFTQ